MQRRCARGAGRRPRAGLHRGPGAEDAAVADVLARGLAAGRRGGPAGARAVAALEGRDYAVPDDVQEVVLPALRHRVMLTPEAEVEGRSADELLDRADPLGGGAPAMILPGDWPGSALAAAPPRPAVAGRCSSPRRSGRRCSPSTLAVGARRPGRPGEPARRLAVPRRAASAARSARWASRRRSRSSSRTDRGRGKFAPPVRSNVWRRRRGACVRCTRRIPLPWQAGAPKRRGRDCIPPRSLKRLAASSHGADGAEYARDRLSARMGGRPVVEPRQRATERRG